MNLSRLDFLNRVSLFSLENFLENEQDYEAVMPVDTWIRKITKSLGLVGQDDTDNQIVRTIIEKCKDGNISPLEINQGIWYVGTHSFELCFDRVLKTIEEMKKGRAHEASNQLLECVGVLEVLSSLEEDPDERARLKDYAKRLPSSV